MIADYHMHTDWSDGRGAHGEYAERADRLGLDEIGFTDHVEFNGRSWVMDPEDMYRYVESLDAARERSRVPLKLGVEMDYTRFVHRKADRFLKAWRRQLDYAIGSSHYMGDMHLAYNGHEDKWEGVNRTQLYTEYYGMVKEIADSGMFDIVGHLDLPKRSGYYPVGHRSGKLKPRLSEAIEAALDAIARVGMCVEVNTSGWRHPCRDQYPSGRLLGMCNERDIEITLGSDAHIPNHVGYMFGKAAERALEAGYSTITVFDKRNREQVDIG
jgi:histidinol-phosphatase (PHP family)